jgi:sarcosine oxidase subunit alpha
MTGRRLARPARIDRAQPLTATFDRVRLDGFAGDTLASALLAAGERVVGRSFKLHRPRGIVTAGPEEPNALVELGTGGRREPNVPATTVELTHGLVAQSQNRWPSRHVDLMAIAGWFAPLLPAGFYYKTFTWPAVSWETLYEPAIRRAAGLGRVADLPDPDLYDIRHRHCDVLVIGAGAAGLAAAARSVAAGARTILVDQDFDPGGGTLLEAEWDHWRTARLGDVAGTLLTRTTAIAGLDHGVVAAVERRAEGQRLHLIRATRIVLATGAVERMPAFPGNDRPGVMLAGAARSYLHRFAVAVGERVAVFAGNDEAYQSALDLAAAGVDVLAVIDPRPDAAPMAAAEQAGITVFRDACVTNTRGRTLSGVTVRTGTGQHRDLGVDTLLVSGGYSPQVQVASQARVPLVWQPDVAGYVLAPDPRVRAAGAAAGVFGLSAAAADGDRVAGEVLATLGRASAPGDLPAPVPISSGVAIFEVPGRGKAFVDLQHDVTADDLRLAVREGYDHFEHAKRYTTHAMGTDQGKIGGLTGSAVLAAARGVDVGTVGLPRMRPYTVGARWGALAGPDVGTAFKPERRLPLHRWHQANGAVFVKIGLWLRPLVYSAAGDTSWGPVLAEARAVRSDVGVTDVSSLGKIDVQGPDAGTFLDRVYANTFSTLAVGRARYGLMLREDGFVFDDGTTSRLGPEHFVITTTTQKADEVLLHLEWHLASAWPDLRVTLASVSDHWAQFAVAGPRARDVLAPLVDIDLTPQAFPFMAAASATIAGVPGRIFRISFSGELAYEVAVPARDGEPVWQALVDRGARPYGLDALNVLRVEKGHCTGAELNGQTTAADLGLQRMLKKSGDFIGAALSTRPALQAANRLQLVGLRPIDPDQRIRGGAQLVAPGSTASIGYVTSTVMSAELGGWLALGLVAGGRQRLGERIVAASPVFGEWVEVSITSPHAVDPENTRIHS